MKKKSTSQSAFFNLRVLIAAVLCLVSRCGAVRPNKERKADSTKQSLCRGRGRSRYADADVVQLIGPVLSKQDLRDLPYIAPSHEFEEKRLMRYPHPEIPTPTKPTSAYERFESLMKQMLPPLPQMPGRC